MYVSKNQAGTGTLVCANGPCELGIINVNTGASSAVVTVYDNTAGSGTKIATIDAAAANSFVYGRRCSVGLTIVVSGGAADVTVCFA
jgi:hypothetical protein